MSEQNDLPHFGGDENQNGTESVSKRIKLNNLNHVNLIQSPSRNFIEQPLFHQTPQRLMPPFIRPSSFISKQKVEKENNGLKTPISTMMQQFEWFKKFISEPSQRDFSLESYMEQVSDNYKNLQNGALQKISAYFQNLKEVKESAIANTFKFFIKVLELMVANELQNQPDNVPNLLRNPEFINALLSITIETYQFINSGEVKIQLLLECCQISSVEFWRIISNFATFSKRIPESIQNHLFEVENKLLLHWIWQDQHEYMLKILISKTNDSNKLRYYEVVLLRRFQQHLALRVLELSEVLQIDQQISEQTWTIVQQIMEDPPMNERLWKNRHLDSIILCTFYMIKKHQKQQPQFKLFREQYERKFNTKQKNEVFPELVSFYNDLYLSNFKTLIPTLVSKTPQPKPMNSIIPISPLPLAVPLPFLLLSPLVKKGNIRPQTQFPIYQFGNSIESPRQTISDVKKSGVFNTTSNKFKVPGNYKDGLRGRIHQGLDNKKQQEEQK